MDFQFVTFDPDPPLGLVLQRSFFARGNIPYRCDKILPTGLIPVLFNLGHPHRLGKSPEPGENAAFSHSWVEGLQTTPNYNAPTRGTHVLGLLFEPLGFHALFTADMPSLRDRTTDSRQVLPRSFVSAVERLLPGAAASRTHQELHALIASWPRQELPDWLCSLYRQIRDTRGLIKLADWYAASEHSARHVSAAFKRAVGVTPKRLCRIHRLLALLEAIEPSRPVNWTELAHRFEFYDQAHFNHEFRALAGLHPSEYLEQRRRELPQLGQGESVVFAPQR